MDIHNSCFMMMFWPRYGETVDKWYLTPVVRKQYFTTNYEL